MLRRRSAFTLTELLIVIGILSILAAIFFPVLVQAREKGHQKQCADNMMLLTQGMLQYVADNRSATTTTASTG